TLLRRPHRPRSSVAASASTASHRAFRDDREPPLFSGETGGVKSLICPTGQAEYFLASGLTANSLICPSGRNCRMGRAKRNPSYLPRAGQTEHERVRCAS